MKPKRPSVVVLLAKRFLFSRSSDGFLSLITGVSVAGVILGVMALTVVTSVINGFEAELSRVITGMNGDVILYTRGSPLRNPDVVEVKIKQLVPETEAVTASFVTELMVSGPEGVAGAVLEGIDPVTIGSATAIPQRLVRGRLPTSGNEIALGAWLAEQIGAEEGARIRLVAPFGGESDEKQTGLDSSAKVLEVTVVGIVKMGMHQYDSKMVFAPIGLVQEFVGHPGRVTSFKLKLRRGADAQLASDALNDGFGYPLRAKDWSQLNKNLFIAIRLEKVVIAIIMTAIIIVAAFNVVSTLMMMIHDKIREISILKAMGLRRRRTFVLFTAIGLGIGAVGTALGIGGGLLVNEIIKKTSLISLPPDVYNLSFLPVLVLWQEIAMIAGFTMLICFVATLYPSLQIARRSPLDGLRFE